MNKLSSVVAVLASVLVTATLVGTAQQSAPAPQTTPGKHPISGRVYAGVMGYQGADWLDRESRDIEEDPDSAIDALGLQRGMTAADIGAGSGYMTVKMSKKVGPTGRVIAQDIQPQMLDLLNKRLVKEKITNVTTLLGLTDDPKLPAGTIDLELLVDVYHEFQEPQKMLRGLRAGLKSGGRLVLLEYRKEDPQIPIRLEHKMTKEEAKLEVEAEGFTLTKVDERLPRQHILIFTKP